MSEFIHTLYLYTVRFTKCYVTQSSKLTIHRAGNGAFVVHVGEENELLVDKVGVGDVVHLLGVKERFVQTLVPLLPAVLQPLRQPLLTTLHTLLAERLVNKQTKRAIT